MLEPSSMTVDQVSLDISGVRVVSNVSVVFPAGVVTGIIGPNGAGKTSLFNVISGLAPASHGEVRLGNLRLTGQPPFQIARLGVARLFQTPHFFATLTALANVQLACLRGESESWATSLLWPLVGSRAESVAREEATRHLSQLGLAKSGDMLASDLSFGQQKLLSFAGILGVRPRCLLLDEPTAGLSRDAADRVLGLSRSLAREGCAVVLIEHNRNAVSRFCDTVVEMERGRLVGSRVISAATPDSRAGSECSSHTGGSA